MSKIRDKMLVLGAGPYQVPLIRKAQALGYIVHAASYLRDDPGLVVADVGHEISILDHQQLIRLCRREHIGEITTAASDLATLTLGRLNEALGIPGLSERQVRAVTDKGCFAELLDELGLPQPASRVIRSQEEMESAVADGPDFPAVLKPLFASGTRGVRFADSAEQVRRFHQECFNASLLDKGYVLQGFLEGVEHGGECLVENGQVVFLQLTHKFHSQQKVPWGHCVPFECPSEVMAKLTEQINRICRHLGVGYTAVNLDVILSPENEPFIIDFSFRLGGNLLPVLMQCRFGVDTYLRVLQHCRSKTIGDLTITSDSTEAFGSIIFGLPQGGILSPALKQQLTRLFEDRGRLLELVFDVDESTAIEPFCQSSHRFGHAVFAVDDLREYQEILQQEQLIVRSRP